MKTPERIFLNLDELIKEIPEMEKFNRVPIYPAIIEMTKMADEWATKNNMELFQIFPRTNAGTILVFTNCFDELLLQKVKDRVFNELDEEEKEVWWVCGKKIPGYFTKGNKYKQVSSNEKITTLIDDLQEEHYLFNKGIYGYFTKIQNKELEEAIEYLESEMKYYIPKIKNAIETILKHIKT